MRKVCKIILIVLFYVFMFWGLVNGVKSILHKNNKCNCNCDKTEKVVEVIEEVSDEEIAFEIIDDKKDEKEEYTKTVVSNNTYKSASVVTGTKEDYQALVNLWERESNWNANAHNKSSGAHGIPQSLPASKMSSEGSDYYTNGYTQIRWGLKYIKERYGSPSAAWRHFQNKNWY